MSPRPASRAGNQQLFEQAERQLDSLLAAAGAGRYLRDGSARSGLFVRVDMAGAADRPPDVGAFRFDAVVVSARAYPALRLARSKRLRISFPVRHFRYWYLLPMRTFALAYLEALDVWLYADATQFVDTSWGARVFGITDHGSALEFENALDSSAIASLARACTISPSAGSAVEHIRSPSLGRSDFGLMQSIASARAQGKEVYAVLEPATPSHSVQILFRAHSQDPNDAPATLRADVLPRAQGLTFSMLYPFLRFGPRRDLTLTDVAWREKRATAAWETGDVPRASVPTAQPRHACSVRLNGVGQKLWSASGLWRSLDLWPLMIEPRNRSYAEQLSEHTAD